MIIQLKKNFLGKKAGERVGVPLADADDLVGEGIARVVADDPLMPLITEHVTAALDKALADHQRKGVRTAPFPGAADQRGGFTNFGELAQCVKAACISGSRPDHPLLGARARSSGWASGHGANAISGMGEYQSPAGGFLVPPEFSKRIFERIYATDTLLGMTDSYTVSSSGIAFPPNNETSRADGSRKGGIRGFWMDEGGQITSSKTTFGRLQLTLHKI